MTSAPRNPTTAPADFLEYQSKSPCVQAQHRDASDGRRSDRRSRAGRAGCPGSRTGSRRSSWSRLRRPRAATRRAGPARRPSACRSPTCRPTRCRPPAPRLSPSIVVSIMNRPVSALTRQGTGAPRGFSTPGRASGEPARRVVEDHVQPPQAARGQCALRPGRREWPQRPARTETVIPSVSSAMPPRCIAGAGDVVATDRSPSAGITGTSIPRSRASVSDTTKFVPPVSTQARAVRTPPAGARQFDLDRHAVVVERDWHGGRGRLLARGEGAHCKKCRGAQAAADSTPVHHQIPGHSRYRTLCS